MPKHPKFYIFLTFLLLLAVFQSSAQTKARVNYHKLVYLPKAYEKDTLRYPLIIYLHGGSQRGNDLDKLKAYGLPYLVDKGQNFSFVIVSPQCPEGKYWSTENWFDSLYTDITSRYRIDKSKVYVTGISIGGYGTYIAAMDNPDKIAAIVPLCGGINDVDTSRIHSIAKMPVWMFHGTADELISIKESERIYNSLKKSGNRVKFTRLKGEGHSIQFLYETKPEIYDWLLKHQKRSTKSDK